MKNIRVSEQYDFMFIGSKPKMKYGTTQRATGSEGALLSTIEVVMIDVFGFEKPKQISVNFSHELGKLEMGDQVFFEQLRVSLYTLPSGKSGLYFDADVVHNLEEKTEWEA